MTTLVIATNVSNPDAEDRRAMNKIIADENAFITRENARLAALVPPGTPIPILPNSTPAERKTSYEYCLNKFLKSAHGSYIKLATAEADLDPTFQSLKPYWQDATPAKRTTASAAFIAALQ